MDTRDSVGFGLSRTEAAKRLGISLSSVRRLEERGELRTVRIGGRVVVPSSEVARLLTPAQPVAKAA
jgi:excisionase family DNA binding protein